MAHPVNVNWELSPRIITVEAPEVEITMQDLHDNLTDIEDTIEGSEHPRLVLSSGKQDLGSGISVGLTVELQDAQLAFEKRVNKLETGTVTTPDATGVTLIDSAATFVTNGVSRGDFVRNHTDGGSVASVLSIDSETQITTDGLTGGTDDQFDSADMYDVMELVQCSASGGNLVAVDSVGATIDPIFPTFGTQVVKTSSSSATLQELSEIQFGQFQNGVAIDLVNGTSGTGYPIGTINQPVNNLAQMVTIANNVGLQRVYVFGDLTLRNEADWSDFTFIGQSPDRTTITVDPSAVTAGTEFEDCRLEGIIGDELTFRFCRLGNVEIGNGEITNTGLIGPIKLNGASGQVIMVDCFCATEAGTTPIIDCNGDNIGFTMHDYRGDIKFTNKTGFDQYHVGINGGHVFLDSTIQAGTFDVTGVFQKTDNSQATMVNIEGDVVGKLQSLLDIVKGDEYYDGTIAIRRHPDTKEILFQKAVTGGQITNPPIVLTKEEQTSLFNDTFTDADATPLQNHIPDIGGTWTVRGGGLEIQSDAVVGTTAKSGLVKSRSGANILDRDAQPIYNGIRDSIMNMATFNSTIADGVIDTVFNGAALEEHSIIFRYFDELNFMRATRNSNSVKIYSMLNGEEAELSNVVHGQDGSGAFKVEFNGIEIKVYSQDILLSSYETETHRTEIIHGLQLSGINSNCDTYDLSAIIA